MRPLPRPRPHGMPGSRLLAALCGALLCASGLFAASGDFCDSSQCLNGGTCLLGQDDTPFYCLCPEGFTGLICNETEKGPCFPNPCRNDAECQVVDDSHRGDVFTQYVCKCPHGYTGVHCETTCAMPLGMETGAISDSQISASSVHLGFMGLQRWAPELARLHRTGIVNAWTASNYDKNPWIQMFVGNMDNSGLKVNLFDFPLEVQYVRLVPIICHRGCTLRFELLGCELNGIFNGVKLVVETPEETLFSHRGANATLPCRYHYEPALLSPRPVRVKWWKLSENGAPEQDVLVAIGRRHRSFGDYRGRVRLRRDEERQVSLQIRDLRLEDSGRYRCEVIDGLEDESGLVELELRGVVFPYQHPRGRYQLSFHEAQRACVEQDAVVASFEQLFRAWEEGLDWCNAGWLQDASVQYPITRVRQPCGGLGLAPGVRSYGPRHHRLHRYDAFCFAPALRGQVYYLEHPEKLTLAEAEEACREDGAHIAKVGQLFAAWKFRGLDRCDAGWLADGSVRYPVVHPRPNCGLLEPGVRSFGFPDPQAREYGVYCYRPR
uniref:Hyaluronan and proteoglycan link protein 3 n=1 Tax=Ailuropoda melanoleuca TaxID=9646 RepID=A0A7N5JN78_AILME